MKSIIHIEAILTFLAWTVIYPQQHLGKDSSIVAIDSTAIVDSAMTGRRTSVIDSMKLKTDSTRITRVDTIMIDSIRIRFIPGMGQIVSDIDTSSVLFQSQFLWSDAKYVGDLIWKLPGFFWRDLGEAGKWGQLNAFGMDGRYISILLDGRPMNDPVTGAYNLYDLPLEFIDHTEIFSGLNSIIASNTSGISMNFVTRSYNSYRPMTKLRFVQDPKGTILTDGIFTQNVARGLNLMIGFQRHTTQGRYTNAELDAWNVRTRLRYNISDRLNIALTDFYTKAANGLNNGVDRFLSTDLFGEAGAFVLNEFALDKRSRHDITLSTIARIFSDSSSTTQASIYYSTLDREYWDPLNFSNIDDSTKSSFWGMRFQQQASLGFINVVLGGQWERRQSDSTRTLPSKVETEKSLFMQAELRLINIFMPSVSIRSISLDGENTLNSGIGVKSEIGSWLTVFADASWYDRFPTIQEQYWKDSRDSTVLPHAWINKEQHTFFQGGLNVSLGSNLRLGLTGFERKIKNAIAYIPAVTLNGSPAISISNINEVKLQGINGSIMCRWYQFELLGVMTLTRYKQADTLKTLIPDVILSGELSYRDVFFKGKFDAKFGVRSRFYKRQEGMQFDPQTLSYVQYKENIIGGSTTLDLFMILKIGDAHLSLSWENILDAEYILTPIYPMPGRHIRLGVNWVFMD